MKLSEFAVSLLSLAACHASSEREAGQSQLQLREKDASDHSILQNKQLRILPLGASITFGYHSSDGNGYRQHLKQMLAPANVTYIGTQCSGTMLNGNNEGHSGYVISQMAQVAAPDLAQMPNVVLIYVGTNDMVYPVDPANAPARMATLVQGLTEKLPGALVVVGSLFLDTNPVVQARINTFNAALPGALRPLQDNGSNVVIANLTNALTKQDLFCDGEHPNDNGYLKMATVLFDSLLGAANQGRVHAPLPGASNGTVCHPLTPTPTGTCTTASSTRTSMTSSTSTTKHTSSRTTRSTHG